MEKISELSLWTKWKRPASVPYPNTWHKFTTKPKDGKIYNIKIVDLTPDRYEECMELTKHYFRPYEPLALSLKLKEDEISYHNDLCLRRTVLQQNMSIVAVLDEDIPKPEIVGFQKLLVQSKDDEPMSTIPGETMQKIYKLMQSLQKNYDMFTIFDTDKILKDFGLYVKSEYSRLNIGYNIVLAIEKLARTFDIKAAAFVCSAIGSQVICEKLGFKLYNEIVYSEYKDEQGQVVCPVEGTKSVKLMAIEYA